MKSVILCTTDRIEEHQEGVNIVLNLIGHPEAFVSDETQMVDFGDEAVEDLNVFVHCKPGDYLWDVARRIEREETD